MELVPAKHRPLTAEEKNELAERYLPMVYLLAKDIRQRIPVNVHFDDLVSAGQWGLVQALEKYETNRKTSFITFAKHRIRGAILDELRRIDPVGRLTRTRLKRLEDARMQLRSELGREPEPEEIDKVVPLKKKQKDRAEQVPRIFSIEHAGIFNEAGQIPDSLVKDALDDVHQEQSAARIERALVHLKPRNRMIIRRYYLENCTLNELAEELGTLESGAWMARTQALQALRRAFAATEKPVVMFTPVFTLPLAA